MEEIQAFITNVYPMYKLRDVTSVCTTINKFIKLTELAVHTPNIIYVLQKTQYNIMFIELLSNAVSVEKTQYYFIHNDNYFACDGNKNNNIKIALNKLLNSPTGANECGICLTNKDTFSACTTCGSPTCHDCIKQISTSIVNNIVYQKCSFCNNINKIGEKSM